MNIVGKFEKVSYEQFFQDWNSVFGDCSHDKVREIYDGIILPKRATVGSAGYDFFAPIALHVKPNETIMVPTGIRVRIEEYWVLQVYPRSGLGFKYRFQLNNTVGIIDSDYYFAKNEGHIFAKFTNATNEDRHIDIPVHTGFMQGIFLQYGITIDDEVEAIREAGFGSTTKKTTN